ncbi:hypothetical protein FB451DRAFT_1470353 [Mycena latifolia]|nr:hypothetical protein FB451DRAFT_1470353 [Mycena latifolia]
MAVVEADSIDIFYRGVTRAQNKNRFDHSTTFKTALIVLTPGTEKNPRPSVERKPRIHVLASLRWMGGLINIQGAYAEFGGPSRARPRQTPKGKWHHLGAINGVETERTKAVQKHRNKLIIANKKCRVKALSETDMWLGSEAELGNIDTATSAQLVQALGIYGCRRKKPNVRSKVRTQGALQAVCPIVMRTQRAKISEFSARDRAWARKVTRYPRNEGKCTKMCPLAGECPIPSADSSGPKATYPIPMRTVLGTNFVYGNTQIPPKRIGHTTAYVEGLLFALDHSVFRPGLNASRTNFVHAAHELKAVDGIFGSEITCAVLSELNFKLRCRQNHGPTCFSIALFPSSLLAMQNDEAGFQAFMRAQYRMFQEQSVAAAPPPTRVQTPEVNLMQTQRTARPAPIHGGYQSARSLPTPQSQPLVAPSSYAPFLGVSTLAPSSATLNTSHVNQARLANASAVLPRQQSLQRRRGRPTGATGRQPPTIANALSAMPRARADPASCTYVDTNHVRIYKLAVHFYPPVEPGSGQLQIAFSSLKLDCDHYLTSVGLAFEYEVPEGFLMQDVITRAIGDIGPNGYSLPPVRRFGNVAGTPPSHVQLLHLVNKGKSTRGLIKLEPVMMPMSYTINDFAMDRNRFGGEMGILERAGGNGNRILIRMTPVVFPLYRHEGDLIHTCPSPRFYLLFKEDGASVGRDLDECSGGEEAEDADDDQAVEVLLGVRASTSATSTSAAGTSALGFTPFPRLTPLPQRSPTAVYFSPTPPLPPTVPVSPATSPTPQPRLVLRDITALRGIVPPTPLSTSIWDENTAADLQEAVDVLGRLVDECGRRNDYSQLLTLPHDRHVSLDRPQYAFGRGVEREAWWALFNSLDTSSLVVQGLDGFYTLRSHFPSADNSREVPIARLEKLCQFGAVSAMLMVEGQYPGRLDPAIFQFNIHGCDIHSLHPAFVSEWHPGHCLDVSNFLQLLPDADPTEYQSLFINHLNSEASAYQVRDEETHQWLARAFLCNPLLGIPNPQHPEVVAFRQGFELRCRNGFTLPSAIKRFEGGSETFLSSIATSFISDPGTLISKLDFTTPGPQTLLAWTTSLRNETGQGDLTFEGVFQNFLNGCGIPCPNQFEHARGSFSPLIDLTRMESPGFRARMVAWAATGSPFIPSDGKIHVGPVATLDGRYAGENAILYARQGIACFRTCSHSMFYPATYVLDLASNQYNEDTEPSSFQNAFDDWMLRQCLVAIGRHSMA